MTERLMAGTRVKHANRIDWGLGEVLESEQDGMVTVFFEDVGLKRFNLSIAQFTKVDGDEAVSDYLTALVRYQKQSLRPGCAQKVGHTTFQKAVENFKSYFPSGFQDPAYLYGPRSERNDKVKAHEFLLEMLNRDSFSVLLEEGNHREICARAKSAVNKTNLIHQYEKIWLANGLADDDAQKEFSLSLHDLLYGTGSPQIRFENFASMLQKINAAKWTIATYFLFLASPKTQIFLKPEVTKSAAGILGIEINYKPELNWLTYSQVLKLADAVHSKLVKEGVNDLVPRDMIDVQSFIWVIAPGYV